MVLAGSSVRENSLVSVKIRSFTAMVSVGVFSLSPFQVFCCILTDITLKIVFFGCTVSKTTETHPPLPFPHVVPPTTPRIDKTALPCFNALPPYPL